MAIGSMTTNSTVDFIDKTLKTKNAPADAKAVGDYILDAEGNVIFYSKAAVDELLKKKLDLTGGTMVGPINFSGGQNGSILSGDEDAANVPGGALNNLVIRSWWGVSFTTDCPNQTYTGKTAIGIDCRDGIIKAPRFEGPADNGVVASGPTYVRFGDGTQICWASYTYLIASSAPSTWTFPVAFATLPAVAFQAVGNDVACFDIVGGAGTATTHATFFPWRGSVGSYAPYGVDAIAIGRWK